MKKTFRILFLFFTTPAQALNLVTPTLNGQIFDLEKMRGKVVVVNFGAEWCTTRLAEMAILDEVYRERHSEGLEIIGISIDRKKALKNVLKRSAKVSYPNSMLVDATVNNFPEINAVPTTYLFDRDVKSQLVAFAEGKVLTTDDFANIFIPALKKLIDTLLRQATGV